MGKLETLQNLTAIVSSFLTIFSFMVSSQISAGNAFQWVRGLETTQWIILTITITSGGAIVAILRLKASHMNSSIGPIDDVESLAYRLNDFKHDGVIWNITADITDFLQSAKIRAVVPPRCPYCRTRLDETRKKIIGGFTWSCIACGFKKSSCYDFVNQSKRIEKMLEGAIERKRTKSGQS